MIYRMITATNNESCTTEEILSLLHVVQLESLISHVSRLRPSTKDMRENHVAQS